MVEQRQVLLGVPGQELAIPALMDEQDDRYTFRPEKWVEPPKQVKVEKKDGHVISQSFGNRLGIVADFEPRVLWGLDGDRPFTILDARMSVEHASFFASTDQIYVANHILWGAHVHDFDEPAEAVRIALPVRWPRWAEEENVVLAEGRLSAWSVGKHPGLIWKPDTPDSIRNLTQRFPTIITTVFQLWTGNKASTSTVEVQIENVGWCTIRSTHEPPIANARTLLGLDKLTVAVIGKWLSKAQLLGPIPYVAIYDGVPLQLDAQMLATALEGLHRRLRPNATRFREPVTKGSLNRARQAGAKAAVEILSEQVDENDAKAAYNEALSHMNEPSYASRITDLLPSIERVAPGLLGPSRADWVQDMKKTRNIQSHGLQDHDDFGESEISQYYVLATSGRWVLKILLLLELIDEDQITLALRESDQFMFSLANIDRENYWKDYSAYGRFLDGM